MSNVEMSHTVTGTNGLFFSAGITAVFGAGLSALVPTEVTPVEDLDLDSSTHYSTLMPTPSSQFETYRTIDKSDSHENIEDVAVSAYQKLFESQEPLGEVFAKTLRTRLWDLYEV